VVRQSLAEICTELAGFSGPLPTSLTRKVVATYGIPIVRSAIVPDIETAVVEAATIGCPLVVKIASPDIAPLALLVANLSEHAADLSADITECDLNPVLLRQVTGEVRVADVLLVAR
jgi:hypothetical protein